MNKKTQVALLLTTLPMNVNAIESSMDNVIAAEETFKGCKHQHRYFDFIGKDFKIEKVLIKKDILKGRTAPLDLTLKLRSKPGRQIIVNEQAFSNLNDEMVNLSIWCPEYVVREKKKYKKIWPHKRLPIIRKYDVIFTKHCQKMFLNSSSIKHIDLSGVRLSKRGYKNKFANRNKHPNSMTGMFSGCTNLENVNFGKLFNTKKVTHMDDMFYGCQNLEDVNLQQLNTSQVTTMKEMFAYCENVKHLDLRKFNTSKVQNMDKMFLSCKLLEDVNLKNINTGELQRSVWMFKDCVNLKNINFGKTGLKTSKLSNMVGMFENCESMETLDMTKFNTKHVKNIQNFIKGCKKLNSVTYHPDAEERMLDAEWKCKGIDLLRQKRERDWETEWEAEENESQVEDKKVIESESENI